MRIALSALIGALGSACCLYCGAGAFPADGQRFSPFLLDLDLVGRAFRGTVGIGAGRRYLYHAKPAGLIIMGRAYLGRGNSQPDASLLANLSQYAPALRTWVAHRRIDCSIFHSAIDTTLTGARLNRYRIEAALARLIRGFGLLFFAVIVTVPLYLMIAGSLYSTPIWRGA